MPLPLTTDQGKDLVKLTIKTDLRHQDYPRVCDIADKYKAYTVAEDCVKLLKQFVPREKDELFKQRLAITSLTTGDLSNTLVNPMYKVGRTTPNQKILWKDKKTTETNLALLTDVSNKFNGTFSVEKYLTYRMVQLDRQDPNTWIVVEFEEAVDPNKPAVKANPYPFEVPAINAINFEFINNNAQWLLVLNDQKTRYTMYLLNDSITADLITKEQVSLIDLKKLGPGAEIFYKDETNKDHTDIYLIQIFNHNANKLPAKRVGTITDPATDNRTCVPMIHAADCYFQKAVKTVSEFDITNALHTFPKVFRYGNRCPGDMKNGIICHEGRQIDGEGEKNCPVCKGTGWSNQTTAAEEIIVAAPKELKDMINLDMMMAYKSPPADLIEFQKKYGLYDLKELAIKAVYNGDTYISSTVVGTATEKNIDLDSVYDTLKPFADQWSDMWIHIMTLIAIYRDLGKDLTISHSFPNDFKMKGLSMLFADLASANNSGAPSYIKTSIGHDIAQKVYRDQPSELLKIQTKEKFYPFNGKSENEINYILTSGLKTRFDQILYASFDQIFDEIDQEQSLKELNFYNMEYVLQKTLVTNKVNEYIAAIDAEAAATRATAFNSGGGSGGPGDGGAPIVGDTVNIITGKEKDPKHAGVDFTVEAINGNSVDLKGPDGTIVKGYTLNDIA